jgi:DNA-directed RNA polymerase specialized sigma24 family protein
VALSLGIPGGTARWRLHRARRQLQAMLTDHPASSALTTRPKEA